MPVTLPPDRNDARLPSGELRSIRVSMRESSVKVPSPATVKPRFPNRGYTLWLAALLLVCLMVAYNFGKTRISRVTDNAFFAKFRGSTHLSEPRR
ncbi:MAG: hypothetical protein ACRYFU_19815 [Janthinobacterium lividum]